MLKPGAEGSIEVASQAPTLAPSSQSVSEKGDDIAQSTRETGTSDSSSSVISAPAPVVVASEAEKSDGLARHTTALSQHGQSIKQVQTREDGTEYPTGVKLTLISLALCLSVFLMALE
jgi:hypothetical protein